MVAVGHLYKSISLLKNQQTYKTIDEIDGVKIIVQDKGQSVKTPEYSHTANRKYAVIQEVQKVIKSKIIMI